MVLAYLLGSIPSAYLAGRMVKGKDIRNEGDHNPGAGNVYRNIGPRAGLIVAAVDIGKGSVAVLLARVILEGTGVEMAAGAAAVAGHNWPIYMKLRGGRGAATTVGVFCGLIPIPAIPMGLAAMALLPVVRSATLMLALIMIPMPLLAWVAGASYPVVAYTVALPLAVGLRHYMTSRTGQPHSQAHAKEEALPQG